MNKVIKQKKFTARSTTLGDEKVLKLRIVLYLAQANSYQQSLNKKFYVVGVQKFFDRGILSSNYKIGWSYLGEVELPEGILKRVRTFSYLEALIAYNKQIKIIDQAIKNRPETYKENNYGKEKNNP